MTERRSGQDRRAEQRGPERRRGRPANPEPSGTVSVWLPASEHDRIVRLAREARKSVSELVRDTLRKAAL